MMVEQAKPAPTYESALSRSWEDVHNRILAMAKDTVFPDSKLAWKPHPDARSVMEELEAAMAGSYPLVKSKPRPQLLGWLEHQGEHYGKLVTAYRVNGVVPPVSRPKK